ncbi:MAG TPA: SDR family oxidoreductase [Egibacteraceae bacterium]|nr:SDR family oxidoreductase [Egibacteraceae bacterium]
MADHDAPLVLVLGASGYVGGRLVPRLLEHGYRVRCLARSPGKLAGNPWAADVEIVRGDLLEAEGLAEAFTGVTAVCHLVHSMGKATVFADADRTIARNVAAAAEAAGVGRIVYLGGLGEVDASTSDHLRSRAEVGQILLASGVPATVLRAAVIIGSGSASFEMLRHLVDKLPVMVTPRWVRTRVQPIAIRDVLRYLVGVIDDPTGDDHVFDIAGPDVLTYEQMMQVYAEVAGLPRRLVLTVPLLTPSLSSHWVNLVTPVPFGLAKPLVLSLAVEVVARSDGEDITALVPGACLPYRDAVAVALQRVRDLDVETSWRDAEVGGRDPADPYPGDPEWSGGTLLSDVRVARTTAPPLAVFGAVTAVGGERGWPTWRLLWEIRGLLDRLVGGIGLRRGRRHPTVLRVGDALDFWRVEEVRAPDDSGYGVLRLRAEMRLPGRAWLEFRTTPGDAGGTVLTQRALFAPKGLFGRLYWLAMAPFHPLIFASMAQALARQAERDGTRRVTSSGGRTGPPAGLVEGDAAPSPEPPPSRRAG